MAAVSALTAAVSFGQPPASEPQAQSAPCAHLADTAISVNATVEAKVDGLDSGRMKPGKQIWFKVVHPVSYPGCTLDQDAVVYGRIMSVNSTRNPDSSELSLAFDYADCNNRDKEPFKLRVIGVTGPPDQSHHLHEIAPTGMRGSGRQIDNSAAGTNALDRELNPGGPAHTVHPGIVVDVPNLTLEPAGGPECSDKLTSTKSKIQLAPGSELILAITQTR
ncbi:MAG TPA: hypothetical protein VGF82_29990 [Terracidiphilus sp.]